MRSSAPPAARRKDIPQHLVHRVCMQAERRSCLCILHSVPCLPGRRGISTERGAGDVVPNGELQAPGMAINLQKAQLKFHSNYLIPLPIIPENSLAVLGDRKRKDRLHFN